MSPRYTQRHFEEFAIMLGTRLGYARSTDDPVMRRAVVWCVEAIIRDAVRAFSENPRFNADRFDRAIQQHATAELDRLHAWHARIGLKPYPAEEGSQQ